ncbi:MAG TPA: NAD(P)-binding domain-containing protein [Candidatus Limnocylindria bacterium]|nr:NAD(P)-binding domain-containing protein [Candidatus Limnocylindria bacterium]
MSTTTDPIDRVHVRFATWRDAAPDEREALLSSAADADADADTDERVVLATCHRVEIVSVASAPPGGSRAVSGSQAVRRVLEVVGGLDSAVVAEEQLLGQVRDAYEEALAAGTSGPILNELFRRALRFGRRVRSHATPGTDRSLADPAVAWLGSRLDAGARVLVVGTGEMGRLVAVGLAAAGHVVTVSSRSPERGSQLLDDLPGTGHDLHLGTLTADLVAAHAAVVLVTRGSGPLLEADALRAHRPWTLDLSMPRLVDRRAAELLGERYLDVDTLGTDAGARTTLSPAAERRLRRELEHEVRGFAAWVAARDGGDAIGLLHGRAAAIRLRHLERVARRADLTPDQLAAVEEVTAAIVGELLHEPSVALRRGGPDAEAISRLFGVER